MKLPNGITGFFEKQNEPPIVDDKLFKQICFNLIKNNGGRILEFKHPKANTNFFDVEVSIFNKHFHILLNAHYPVISFASLVTPGEIDFIDEPQLYIEFSPFYTVLRKEELNESIIINSDSKTYTIQIDNEMNSAELKQIAYWKPERIGFVIFNHWD
jgi:hypothetical protein